MLQKLESKGLLGLDRTIDPALLVPDSLRPFGIRTGPGEKNYYGQGMNPEMVASVYQIAFNIKDTQEKIFLVEQMIDRALFRDVFLSMTNLPADATAYQAAKVWEEKITRIGPTVEIVEDVLRASIDRYWEIALSQNRLPPPPASLPGGLDIKVEYNSFLAQARRQIGTSSILQALSFNQQQAQTNPDAVDIWNSDEAQEEMHKALGISPKLLRSKEELQAIREQKAQAQQAAMQQQQMQQLGPLSQAVKAAGQTQVNGKNLIEQLVDSQ